MTTALITRAVDLRRAPLAGVRAVDFRARDRDFWADDAAIWDRFVAMWAGLDDAAWLLPGAARSDAGGPDWSLFDHVAHVVDWQEIAIGYLPVAIETGRWPTDEEYDAAEFDTFNEDRRARFAGLTPTMLRIRALDTHERLAELVRRLPMSTIRSDEAWGWVYLVLHGHRVDHLGVLEPWAGRARVRQVENDPFGPDPQPVGLDISSAVERFGHQETEIFAQFDELVRVVPFERWSAPGPTPEWSLADHVGHMARWFEAGATALEGHAAGVRWEVGPTEGVDAWNAREVSAMRGIPPATMLARFDAARARLSAAAAAMTADEWRDPEGWSWAYDCLHGHVRTHLAMIGPWCVRLGWPMADEDSTETDLEAG